MLLAFRADTRKLECVTGDEHVLFFLQILHDRFYVTIWYIKYGFAFRAGKMVMVAGYRFKPRHGKLRRGNFVDEMVCVKCFQRAVHGSKVAEEPVIMKFFE